MAQLKKKGGKIIMKKFETPVVEVMAFSVEDVITTSGGSTEQPTVEYQLPEQDAD